MENHINLQTFESPKVVNDYKRRNNFLFPAEKVILGLLTNKIRRETILDLGIGAGRTTVFFAPYFNHYIGIDFSSGMIHACRKTFAKLTNAEFIVADVTSLPNFSVNGFDFVLFSFNGIDCLKNVDERIALLSNVYNLLNYDGIFVFSSHNTLALKRLYSF